MQQYLITKHVDLCRNILMEGIQMFQNDRNRT